MNLLGKMMAIDYGKKRHGIAISDALGMMAHPRDFVPSGKHALNEIKNILEEESVQKLIVGMPITLKGEQDLMANEVLEFITLLKSQIEIPIVEWDERLSTAQAEKTLIAQDVRRSKRKVVRDSMAATIILQSYLDSLSQGAPLEMPEISS